MHRTFLARFSHSSKRNGRLSRALGNRKPCSTRVSLRLWSPANIARSCGKVLIAQEANLAVSVSSEVSAIVAEECFEYLDAPVMRIGGPEVPAMPFAKSLEDAYLVDVDKLESKLRSLAEY